MGSNEPLAAALWQLASFDDPGESEFSPGLVGAINVYLKYGGKLVEVAKMFDVDVRRVKQELRKARK